MCIDVTVAPSTTIAAHADVWRRNERVAAMQLRRVVSERRTALTSDV